MLESKFNSSQKIKSMISQQPIISSEVNSVICRQTFSGENLQCDFILNQQRSIVKENLDKLKNLLSQNKQFAKKNKADLSPERKINDDSISKFKYCTPNDQRSQKSKFYINSQQKSRQTLSPKKLGHDSLIIDIKRKIKGSPNHFQEKLAQGYFTKDIIRPQTVSFYSDELVNFNKQINILIQENQKLQSKLGDQNAIINQLNQQNQALQNKLEKIINLSQQNEQKFHSILFEKEEIIRNQVSDKEQLQLKIKSNLEYFFTFYLQKINYLTKKVNIKVTNIEKRLQIIHQKSLMKMHKKVQLQKLIFESSTPYRKSKNLLQKSPSIKGDNFQEIQLKSHEIEKEIFEREAQYQKNKYEKAIKSYKQNYDDLYEKFLSAQKKNETLKSEIMNMKHEQQKFLKNYQQNQKLLEQERKNSKIQHNYFKKQLAQLKIQDNFLVQEKQDNCTVKSELNTPRSGKKSKHSPKSLYLKLGQGRSERSDKINESQKITLNIEEKFKQKEKQLLEKQVELQLKEKQFEVKQKQFQQHVKIKQQYFDQLNHIKNILQTVHQSNSTEMNSNNIDKNNKKQQIPQEQKIFREQKTPIRLRQLSKVQYLAKKQKRQKQIAQSRIQALEKQLQYQKTKNSQLESLIEEKQSTIFQQIREKVLKIEDQPVCQSLQQSAIHEEESPFDPMLQTLTKERNKSFCIEENEETVLGWQSKVKSRLENAIERLQALEILSSSRTNKKDEVSPKQQQMP